MITADHFPNEPMPGLRARKIALDVILEVEHRGAYADVMLGERLRVLSRADRRLATRLALGTIAWRARLDYELARFCGRPLESLQPRALAILRMGLFQLRMLDRIPRHASVSTSVELAKRSSDIKAAAGLINAVMRRAAREEIELPDRRDDEIGWLALAHSHPRWMVERFVEWFGIGDAQRLMAANNEAAPNAARLNLARASREEIVRRLESEGVEVERGRFPETVILRSAPLLDSSAYREGLAIPQSEASQVVVRMLAPARGATVVDCAAAPGGKSCHLAELTGPSGRVLAIDLNPTGLGNAREMARRLGHRNIGFIRADTAAALPLRAAAFDYVLLDAPCTGLGTLREHPEIRWRLAPGDPCRMGKLQLEMLAKAAALLRAGGAIVYSVCSIAPDEGENVVRAFLDANPDFRLDPSPPNRDPIADLLDGSGAMKTRPDLLGMDGFFAARIVRTSNQATARAFARG
jgi:16S rRNA (cytosine967-C5)-methyltransferase